MPKSRKQSWNQRRLSRKARRKDKKYQEKMKEVMKRVRLAREVRLIELDDESETEDTDKNATENRKKEVETGRRSSRRAAQVATQKIHNSVRDSGRFKSILSDHSSRASVPDIDLQMECHEELLSPIQAETILKAQYEYNCVMKKLRDLKASNARIICTNYDGTEIPIVPSTRPVIPMSSSSSSSSQKITNVITLSPTGAVLNSTNTLRVVPMRLVTVHPQLSSISVQPKSDSPAFIASDRISHNDSKYFFTTVMLHQRS